MILEEFGPELRHIKGSTNIVADALSQLPMEHLETDMEQVEETVPKMSYVTKENIKEEEFPMSPRLIHKCQLTDKHLKKLMKEEKSKFTLWTIENIQLIHYEDKIYIPHKLQSRIISWYHHYLIHPGETRMEETFHSIFYWPSL